MRAFVIVFVLTILAQAAEPLRCPEGPSRLAMDKGEYASRPGVVFALQNFSANMVPRGKKMPLCLAKVTDIEHGHVMASSASLTKLFAQKMKTSNQQSITGIDLHTKGDHVVIRGTVHKRIGIPFEIEGRVDNVEGRAIRLHAEKIKAVGLPVKGLLNMLGVELGSLINPDSTAGVTVQENSILFDPEQLANIRGHFTKLQVVGNGLVVDFGPAATQPEAKLNRTRQ